MENYISKEIQAGFDQAKKRSIRKSGRLCVHADGAVYSVTRIWDGGFAMPSDQAPNLRGFVNLYDGPKHLYQCLIVFSKVENDEKIYDYKRHTEALDSQPVDFERKGNQPAGLLGW